MAGIKIIVFIEKIESLRILSLGVYKMNKLRRHTLILFVYNKHTGVINGLSSRE